MNPDEKLFVVHIASLSLGSWVVIYPASEAQIVTLDTKKVIVLPEYSNYANVFLKASAIELSKHTGINDYPINLVDDKEPPYGLIYSLKPVYLETLKTYIETNLANNFIQPS